ncbi:MAG: nuclear transport factor 2 family protein [Polyangiaceae bacterium]
MTAHLALVERFFSSLGTLDARSMVACYAPEAEYSSVALGRLTGAHVPAFWRMVCARGNLRSVTLRRVHADSVAGVAEWSARYVCGTRTVEQATSSTFHFKSGRIVRQYDRLGALPQTRTVGSEDMLHDERMALLVRLRARAFATLDRFLDLSADIGRAVDNDDRDTEPASAWSVRGAESRLGRAVAPGLLIKQHA